MYDPTSHIWFLFLHKIDYYEAVSLPSLIYDCLSRITIALPLSAALIIMSPFVLNDFIALYPSFVRFFFLGSLYFAYVSLVLLSET